MGWLGWVLPIGSIGIPDPLGILIGPDETELRDLIGSQPGPTEGNKVACPCFNVTGEGN